MRRFLLILLLVLSAFAKTGNHLAHIKKIYVARMENDLDQYLVSEIGKQFRGTVTVVPDVAGADAILEDLNPGEQNASNATLELVDLSTKTVVWIASASDRDTKFLDLKHSDEQTMAARLISQLKKALQHK